MANEMMNQNVDKTVMERKYVYKDEDHKEYASKGVAGTALGFGIGGLALSLLNGGLGNILGWNNGNGCQKNGCNVTCDERLSDRQILNDEIFSTYKSQVDGDFALYKSQIDADFMLYKGYRDANDRMIEKHNADAFALYKYSRDGFDVLKNEICDLKTKLAVSDATKPYEHKIIMDAIALEAERRQCADCNIVNYVNNTFIPQYVADVTTGTTTTQKSVFNPLCCLNRCGCGQ